MRALPCAALCSLSPALTSLSLLCCCFCDPCSESVWQSLAERCGQRISFLRFVHAHGPVVRRAASLVAGQRRQRLSSARRSEAHAHEQSGQHWQSGCAQSRPGPSLDRNGSAAVRVAHAAAARTPVRIVARRSVAHLCRRSSRVWEPHGSQRFAHLSAPLLQLRGSDRERDPARFVHDCLPRPQWRRSSALFQQHVDDR